MQGFYGELSFNDFRWINAPNGAPWCERDCSNEKQAVQAFEALYCLLFFQLYLIKYSKKRLEIANLVDFEIRQKTLEPKCGAESVSYGFMGGRSALLKLVVEYLWEIDNYNFRI